jgi:hypothetical protein
LRAKSAALLTHHTLSRSAAKFAGGSHFYPIFHLRDLIKRSTVFVAVAIRARRSKRAAGFLLAKICDLKSAKAPTPGVCPLVKKIESTKMRSFRTMCSDFETGKYQGLNRADNRTRNRGDNRGPSSMDTQQPTDIPAE